MTGNFRSSLFYLLFCSCFFCCKQLLIKLLNVIDCIDVPVVLSTNIPRLTTLGQQSFLDLVLHDDTSTLPSNIASLTINQIKKSCLPK